VAGAVLSAVEDWSFWTGMQYVLMNVAHLPPPRPLTEVEPESLAGGIFDIVVALFVVSITIHAYTLACWPRIVDQAAEALEDFSLRLPGPYSAYFVIVFVIFTASFLLFVIIVGPILAVLEGWGTHLGIVYTAALVSQQALTDVKPDSVVGALICSLVGMWALGLLGAIIGLSATLEFPAICARATEQAALKIQTTFRAGEFSAPGKFTTLLLFGFIVVPVLGCAFGLVFGAIIALAEGWSIEEGFLYVCTNVLILPGPLTEVLPETFIGMWISLVVSIWGLLVIVSVFVVLTLFEDDMYPAKIEEADSAGGGMDDQDGGHAPVRTTKEQKTKEENPKGTSLDKAATHV